MNGRTSAGGLQGPFLHKCKHYGVTANLQTPYSLFIAFIKVTCIAELHQTQRVKMLKCPIFLLAMAIIPEDTRVYGEQKPKYYHHIRNHCTSARLMVMGSNHITGTY